MDEFMNEIIKDKANCSNRAMLLHSKLQEALCGYENLVAGSIKKGQISFQIEYLDGPLFCKASCLVPLDTYGEIIEIALLNAAGEMLCIESLGYEDEIRRFNTYEEVLAELIRLVELNVADSNE